MTPAYSVDQTRAFGGPDWLITRRARAAEAFSAATPPKVSDEQWRYSRIGDLELDFFAPVTPALQTTSQAAAKSSTPLTPPNSHQVIFADSANPELTEQCSGMVRVLNGVTVSVHLDAALTSAGVFVGAISDHSEGEEILGSLTADAGDYFTLLNDAFAPEPLIVDVPKGVVVADPIIVALHASGNAAACFPRLFIRVGTNAEATLVEVGTAEDERLLVCPTTEIDVAAAGRLRYLNVQALGRSAWQIGSQLARAQRDATIVAGTATFGGNYSRSRSDTRLLGRGAHGELIGVYFADGSQTQDFRTYQDHVAPNTTSNLLYKGVVADRSRSVYTGLIRIRPDARGVDAFQTNRNLKIGDDAWAESVPNLEIENNDVHCSHASAVGPLDEDQRFYLESRGVPTPQADRLIVAGFLGEVIDALGLPSAAPLLRRAVADKLDTLTIPELIDKPLTGDTSTADTPMSTRAARSGPTFESATEKIDLVAGVQQ